MVTFFIGWGVISLIGTLFALSLIRSGKRNTRERATDLPPASSEAQPAPVKLLA
jgi:hypothetical protein